MRSSKLLYLPLLPYQLSGEPLPLLPHQFLELAHQQLKDQDLWLTTLLTLSFVDYRQRGDQLDLIGWQT